MKILLAILLLLPAMAFAAEVEWHQGRYELNSNHNGIFVLDNKDGRVWTLQTGNAMPQFVPIFFVLGNDSYSVYPSSYATPVLRGKSK